MKPRLLLCAVLILSFVVPLCFAADRGPSTPEERARAVEIAKKMEAYPLNKQIKDEYKWLLVFAIQIPDISIPMCTAPVIDAMPKKYKYGGELGAQIMASSLAFAIEHPDKAKDQQALFLAGTEGALRVYEVILKQDPKARLDKLDELIKMRESDTLADHVKRTTAAVCKGASS